VETIERQDGYNPDVAGMTLPIVRHQ